MKTIEKKAKAYDEALSVARKTHQTQPMYRDWLEKMFPELAESEDKRVIKFIKNQLFNIKKTITDNYKLDTELTKAIDWLEKQGEKPQRIVSAEAKEAMYDKPAPVRTGAIGFDGEPMESKPCEQKPAWSEEDENKVTLFMQLTEGCDNEEELADWLKSLRPQSQWKPSGEQINAIKDAIIMYEGRRINAVGLKGLLEQLKKLSEE